jgi:hypothetical protein
MTVMKTKLVTVRNGRAMLEGLDEYPDGTELEVGVIDDDEYAHLEHGDDMDDEDREALHASLREAIAQGKAGLGRPAEEVLAELKRIP